MDKISFIPKGQQPDFFVLFWQFSLYFFMLDLLFYGRFLYPI